MASCGKLSRFSRKPRQATEICRGAFRPTRATAAGTNGVAPATGMSDRGAAGRLCATKVTRS